MLAPRINQAAINLLTRHGIEVVLVKDEQCCGALTHHLGRDGDALARARANVTVWQREAEQEGLDAILVTTSGCGTVIKDYGFMLREDRDFAGPAARISALAKDITEYLAGIDLNPSSQKSDVTIAYHSACSLQHGQKITQLPKELLSKNGFVVKDVPESHLCCGSAGTYNILQPDIASRLRDRKVANIATVKPDMIAAGNIGCMVQIAGGTSVPVVHTIELLDWATGGPKPELRGTRIELIDRASSMIRKCGHRFSDKIMLRRTWIKRIGSTEFDRLTWIYRLRSRDMDQRQQEDHDG